MITFRIAQPQVIHEVGQRSNQEDSFRPLQPTPATRCFVLCDGMGGHEGGEVASQAVCETMTRYVDDLLAQGASLDEEAFKKALAAAYDRLDALDDPDVVRKMGTTLTFLCFHGDGVTVAHIGDSRIYQIRPSTGEILYKSRDHSLVRDLFELGEITAEEMATSPKRNIITRCMQPHQERRDRADVRLLTDVCEGDYFYMCSDGMLEHITDQQLVDLLRQVKTPDEEKRQWLVDNSQANKDNHTAFLIHVTGVKGASRPVVLADRCAPRPSEATLAPSARRPSPASRPSAKPAVWLWGMLGLAFLFLVSILIYLFL